MIAKFQVAFTPPVYNDETSFFQRRVMGTPVHIRLEQLRLIRQRRSIWKKLFLDGVIVPYHDG
jgi:hypothetical protein